MTSQGIREIRSLLAFILRNSRKDLKAVRKALRASGGQDEAQYWVMVKETERIDTVRFIACLLSNLKDKV